MDKPEIPASALLGIWKAAPVEVQPKTTLTRWGIYEVQLPGESQRTRHFVGCSIESWREGHTSSKIISLDVKTGKGVTRGGRMYVLHDLPGLNLNAEHTWCWWCEINQATDIVDVTEEVWAAMKAASP